MSTPLLQVEDLRISYAGRDGRREVVHGASFDVHPGEVVAVVGESGSGKSTTAHAVVGLLPGNGSVDSGSVLLEGDELVGLGEGAWRRVRGARIGLVPQDPTLSLNPVERIGDQVAEALHVHGLARGAAARARAVDLLTAAGLPDAALRARQYPTELSGGMRQRVLIAIGLAAGPRLLVADEPTSALDVTVQRQVLDHLEALTRDAGTAVLLITHDLAVAADRASRVVVMSGGEVVEVGTAHQVLTRPRHPYTASLLASAPSLSSARITARPRPRTAPPEPPEPPAPRASGPLVQVRDLVKEFPLPGRGRTQTAVAGVSFDVARGETLALVGESGSGKTTTARLVLGLERPTSGEVRFDGEPTAGLRGAAWRELRRRVQLVYQNPYASLDPRVAVGETVAEPLRAFGIGDRASRRRRAASLLDQVRLPAGLLERRPAELSGGQRQRVAIARALALEPELVVCDEPVSALDVSVQAQILELLVQLQADHGLSYLFISHDLAVVRQVSDRVGVVRRGELVELGPTDEVFSRPRHEYTVELLEAIPGRRALEDVS
ncbi:dipeptide ABC transporter ATP-binding protein [Kineococcus radiotolerans]|uniref:ABC transporter related n=1 Tax=Kineococcus radiotolerans (strain ATCC BAA-149 / DSM 14245 / SRS30216) TaxID=266940 RepID=A6W6J1_KINRD|nr:ABC transporter ATP-binding protein [Kineococcus radiotolerans]ABS02430.1 ABC transporter related [Kineococcus radiotolerans SRS30216 = ATCC BAA-149]